MALAKGRNVRVEFAATYGSPVTVSAVTQANPGVATATAHGQVDGTIGYMSSVEGMVQLEGQAVRVDAPNTNDFQMQGLNTTSYSAFSGTAQFVPVATWHTLAEATGYGLGGGESEKLDATALIDVIKQEEAGNLAAQTMTINVLAQDAPSAAMAALMALAQSGTKAVFRVLFPSGALRILYGEPSLPGEDVQRGQLGTGSLSITVKGVILQLAA